MDGYYPDMGVAEYGYNNSYGAPWQDGIVCWNWNACILFQLYFSGYIKQPYDEMDYQYDGENYPVADENSEIVDGGNVSKMTDVAPGDEDYQQQNSSYGKEPIQTSGYADKWVILIVTKSKILHTFYTVQVLIVDRLLFDAIFHCAFLASTSKIWRNLALESETWPRSAENIE